MNVDQAIGYLVRDPSSVEAEAARVLLHEITSRSEAGAVLTMRNAQLEAGLIAILYAWDQYERNAIDAIDLATVIERVRQLKTELRGS
jgi:hypothetical protein